MGIVIAILFLVCIGLIIFAGVIYRKNEKLHDEQQFLEDRIHSLIKYQDIIDIKAEVEKHRDQIQILEKSARERINTELAQKEKELSQIREKHLQELGNERQKLDKEIADKRKFVEGEEAQMRKRLASIDEEIKQLTKEAKQTLTDARKEKELILNNASLSAAKIIDNANEQAKHVGEEALDAQKNFKIYKNGLSAMKRKVHGYGDEWLIPNHSSLDDLAEEYSYKDTGKQLKLARERTRQFILMGRVADCDYAEKVRRETAIAFVTDAFNGGVDSILSGIKHDNYGKMEKKIKDIYDLVNLNGSAFRNARILPEYLQARLDELDWGVKALVLQQREREEQREIREQMREEERARREYEKAIKESEKEEQMLSDAMAKARAQLEVAQADERAMFEQQLAELELKWKEAEEKNQRAISMAQQTKRGHVYVISNIGSFGENIYKIGLTRRLEPLDRVKELGDASVPFEFDVHSLLYSEDAPALETKLHQEFRFAQVNKVNPRKEFFRLSLADIKKLVDEMGIESKWTMAAEAAQYRETKALEADPDLLQRRMAVEPVVTGGWDDDENENEQP